MSNLQIFCALHSKYTLVFPHFLPKVFLLIKVPSTFLLNFVNWSSYLSLNIFISTFHFSPSPKKISDLPTKAKQFNKWQKITNRGQKNYKIPTKAKLNSKKTNKYQTGSKDMWDCVCPSLQVPYTFIYIHCRLIKVSFTYPHYFINQNNIHLSQISLTLS